MTIITAFNLVLILLYYTLKFMTHIQSFTMKTRLVWKKKFKDYTITVYRENVMIYDKN